MLFVATSSRLLYHAHRNRIRRNLAGLLYEIYHAQRGETPNSSAQSALDALQAYREGTRDAKGKQRASMTHPTASKRRRRTIPDLAHKRRRTFGFDNSHDTTAQVCVGGCSRLKQL